MPSFSDKRERLLLLTLLAAQFTHLLDFVIMMPLGPQLMRVFEISAQEFGFLISAYTFSAGVTGFLSALWIDRFDRRSALLALYSGFGAGTLLCGLASGYVALTLARIVVGGFCGVLGALVFAIIGDAIPEERRGAATGVVMSAFALASVAGVPIGLWLANRFGWRFAFLMLAVLCATTLALAYNALPPMRAHLQAQTARQTPLDAMRKLFAVVSTPNHLNALAFMSLLMIAGFTVIPYISPYFVANVGLSEGDLPLIYFFGGAATIFTSRLVGGLADRFGKARTFAIAAIASVIVIYAITNLPRVPLALALLVTTLFTIAMNGRLVPAVALVASSVDPKTRGSFMSVNSAFQQLASGASSVVAGMILGKAADGSMTNYHLVGFVAIGATLLCVALAKRIRVVEESKGAESPALLEEP
ncbi:MAG: MFS transporter [Chloroherpetonaceae bacterium]|nr:MFS transporter [Chloroherpetonaceae bacterium]MDW8438102.1 MFS transporter [Chloroherpetonaceae bacterium]